MALYVTRPRRDEVRIGLHVMNVKCQILMACIKRHGILKCYGHMFILDYLSGVRFSDIPFSKQTKKCEPVSNKNLSISNAKIRLG